MSSDRGTLGQHHDRAAEGLPGPVALARLRVDVGTEVNRLSNRPTRVRGRRPLLELLGRIRPSALLRRSTMVPPQTRGRGRGEDELGSYIERELQKDRNLFDVLGDRTIVPARAKAGWPVEPPLPGRPAARSSFSR